MQKPSDMYLPSHVTVFAGLIHATESRTESQDNNSWTQFDLLCPSMRACTDIPCTGYWVRFVEERAACPNAELSVKMLSTPRTQVRGYTREEKNNPSHKIEFIFWEALLQRKLCPTQETNSEGTWCPQLFFSHSTISSVWHSLLITYK